MAYTTAADVREYLNIDGTDDDDLLADLIAAAQAQIEEYTGRAFECAADTTRYFTVGTDTDGRLLTLDHDLCAITTVTTNADNGSGGTALTAGTDYFTVPRNDTPYYAIKLTASTGYSWTYTTDPEAGVEVTGKWAYSETPPNDVVHACKRLVGYMYKQRDTQVYDTTASPGAGTITIPQGMPRDVQNILKPYKARL